MRTRATLSCSTRRSIAERVTSSPWFFFVISLTLWPLGIALFAFLGGDISRALELTVDQRASLPGAITLLYAYAVLLAVVLGQSQAKYFLRISLILVFTQ